MSRFLLSFSSSAFTGREPLGISVTGFSNAANVLPATNTISVKALKGTQSTNPTSGLASSFLHPPPPPQPFYGRFSGTTRVSWCQKNFWTLWCKGRLTEADTLTIRLGDTPSGLTSAPLHYPPIFFMGQMPFLPPNQQCQSTVGGQTSLQRNVNTLIERKKKQLDPLCCFGTI